jgi:hypothetical protein
MWPDAPTHDLLKMVYDNHRGGTQSVAINFNTWACPALTEFMGHALRVLMRYPEKGQLIAFASLLHPSNHIQSVWGYFPHRHQPDSFYTLVHYLTPGDGFAPLVVFEGDEHSKAHLVTPETGLTVVFGGPQLHGVLRNGGNSDRIALVVNSVPDHDAMETLH